MSRSTRLFVFGTIAAMAAVAVAVLFWRWQAPPHEGVVLGRKLIAYAFALVFVPLWLGLGTLFMHGMLARPRLQLADDARRAAEVSLVGAAVLAAGVQLWTAAAVVLGEPPGRELGVRLIEVVTGIFFIVSANFAAKTSPPQGWPDPGAWIRATLRTGWIGVAAGVAIVAGAIAAPVGLMVWIVGAATALYAGGAVLNHLRLRRKPA